MLLANDQERAVSYLQIWVLNVRTQASLHGCYLISSEITMRGLQYIFVQKPWFSLNLIKSPTSFKFKMTSECRWLLLSIIMFPLQPWLGKAGASGIDSIMSTRTLVGASLLWHVFLLPSRLSSYSSSFCPLLLKPKANVNSIGAAWLAMLRTLLISCRHFKGCSLAWPKYLISDFLLYKKSTRLRDRQKQKCGAITSSESAWDLEYVGFPFALCLVYCLKNKFIFLVPI